MRSDEHGDRVKGLAIDRWLWHILTAYPHQLMIGLLLAASVVIRICLAPETGLSADYDMFIKAWPEKYRELGFIRGMGQVIGDYYVPFNIMYAIVGLSPWEPWVLTALFSSIMDYLTAFAVFLTVRELLTERGDSHAAIKAGYMAAIICLLPFVFMNSALWKQVDAFYISFAMLAVYFLLRDRTTTACVLLGISLAFKLQAVFFLPFFMLIYIIRRNYSILKLLWLPVIYLIAGIPAVLCRRGLRATYLTYVMQMREGEEASEGYGMVALYPNLYNFGMDDYLTRLALPAVLITFAILLLSIVLVMSRASSVTNTQLWYVLAWQLWTCTMFLPSMHDRYDYGAVLIFSMLMCVMPGLSAMPAAVLNIGSFMLYAGAADAVELPMQAMSVIYAAAWCVTTYHMVRMIRGGRGDA